MKDFFSYTLPNGIRCIHKRTKSQVAYCAMTINAGSRDELPREEGIAHFTEHALFKGTERRKAYQVNSRLEKLGGELNAFTTKEETVVHATTLRTDFSKAVELIADILFHSTFPSKEIEKERDIIIDEINSYKDSPAERIYDEFEDLLFSDSPLGHNILGNRSSVSRFRDDDIRHFTDRCHNTDQMVFASIGNLSERSFKQTVDRYFAEIPPNFRHFSRSQPSPVSSFNKAIGRNTHQGHCIMGTRAYSLNHPKRVTLALLVNLLGGPAANSMLNVLLREKYGLTYCIESTYTPYCDTGVASIYFGTDRDKTHQCIELVEKVLSQLKNTMMSSRRLSMAKKQFIGQLAISMESNEGYMLSAGKSYLTYNDIDSPDVIYKKVLSITPQELIEVANEIYGTMSILSYK